MKPDTKRMIVDEGLIEAYAAAAGITTEEVEERFHAVECLDVPELANIQVGTRIRNLRQILGLSQGDLAAAAGIPAWKVDGYEDGNLELDYETQEKIVRALGMTQAEFFSGPEFR